MLTWKTHNDGKNHGNPQAAKIHYEREDYSNGSTKGNDLLHPLSSPHAAVTMEATTSLSLSLSFSLHTLYNYFTKVIQQHFKVLCPKSYLYIYDFRVIYICVPTNRSDGSEPDLGSSSSPYLSIRRDLFPNN